MTYQCHGTNYTREYFCSHPDGVLVARLTADHPGGYTGSLTLQDAHEAPTVADGHTLTAAGSLTNGLHYESKLIVLNDGGTLTGDDGKITFTGCNGLTLVFAAGTDYVMDAQKNYRGELPEARVDALTRQAAAKSYADLKAAHEADFHALFDRVTLNVGRSSPEQQALPTNARKVRAATTPDPELEAAAVPVRPLPADFLLAARRSAGEFAGAVERQQQSPVALAIITPTSTSR